MSDARFEDGGDSPLNLGALDAEDLAVLASLTQDAVFPAAEMSWDRSRQRFGLLLNRFRWEDGPRSDRAPERVQSVLMFSNVLGVSSNGIDRDDRDLILSLLSVQFEETDTPSGHVVLTLAGDGAIRLSVEALEAQLRDVTRPYAAPSRKTPDHPD